MVKWLKINDERIKDMYEVSTIGEVRNIKSKRTLAGKTDKNGYITYTLAGKEVKSIFKQGHRLVLEAFNPVPGMETIQVNHRDENKSNNSIENLEWCTAKYNVNYGEGSSNRATNLRIENRRKVRVIDKDGNTVLIADSSVKAAKAVGRHSSSVYACLNGCRTESNGFTFEYVEKEI